MNAMERHGRLELNLGVWAGVLAPSAATIDRALTPCREGVGREAELAFGGTLQRAVGDSGSDVHRLARDSAPGFVGTLRRMASGNMRELGVCVAVHCLKHPRRDRR